MRLEIIRDKGDSAWFRVLRGAILHNTAHYLDLVAKKEAWRLFGKGVWWRANNEKAAPLSTEGLKRVVTESLDHGYERRIYVGSAVSRGEVLLSRDDAELLGIFKAWLAKRCPFPFPLGSDEAVAALMERLKKEFPRFFVVEAKNRADDKTMVCGLRLLDPSRFEREIVDRLAKGIEDDMMRTAERIFLETVREHRLHEAARIVDRLLADAPDGSEVDMASGMEILAIAEEESGGATYHIVARDGEEFLALVDDGESRWWDTLSVKAAESMAIRAVDNMRVHGDAIEKEAA